MITITPEKDKKPADRKKRGWLEWLKHKRITPNIIVVIFAVLLLITIVLILIQKPDIGALLWIGSICGMIIIAYMMGGRGSK